MSILVLRLIWEESRGFCVKSDDIRVFFFFLVTLRHSLTPQQFCDTLRLSQDEQLFLNSWQNSNGIEIWFVSFLHYPTYVFKNKIPTEEEGLRVAALLFYQREFWEMLGHH